MHLFNYFYDEYYRSVRSSYGDSAIGYVQVKRGKTGLCTVRGVVTPEHKVTKTPYEVEIKVNEKVRKITFAQCKGCQAAKGGCKHALAMLFWLLRRSEEPSVTSRACYWNKPKLGKIGSTVKFIKLSEIIQCKKKRGSNVSASDKKMKMALEKAEKTSESFFENCAALIRKKEIRNQLSGYLSTPNKFSCYSLHHLILCSREKALNGVIDIHEFLDFVSNSMNQYSDTCEEVAEATKSQSKNVLWFELRYGRVTASNLYEAAHCRTVDGSLVDSILGASKVPITDAIQRGKDLEDEVLTEVEKLLKKKKSN